MIGKKLYQIMQQDKMPPQLRAAYLLATVISISPLSIRIDGEQNIITNQFIAISPFCKRMVLPKPHKHFDTPPDTPITKEETEEIEMWRGLRAGDKVVALKLNNAQIYYVVHRVVMEGMR